MNPEIFEIIMLVCFGAAWPLSIYKLLKTKNSGGKSLGFTGVLLICNHRFNSLPKALALFLTKATG